MSIMVITIVMNEINMEKWFGLMELPTKESGKKVSNMVEE